MGFDKVKVKQICWLILYVAVILFALLHIETVVSGIGIVVEILKPFFIGGIIAFILNIPMRSIENKLLGRWQGKTSGAKRPVSMILSILFLAALVTLVVVAIVPQMRNTFTTLGEKLPVFYENVMASLENLAVTYPELGEQLESLATMEFDWNSIISTIVDFLRNGVTNMLSSTVNVASGIIGGVTKGVVGFIFALYVLAQKEKLQDQAVRILFAYLPEKTGKHILEVCRRLHVNFTNFICGQCLEAVILGCMFVIVMSLVGMPYAIMIGTLVAFTALIPIVGAFIGCFIGAFLILIDDPVKALWFVVIFLILQQVEGNLIYPRVVGNSVGLPSIWVLASVSVGGSLFGVFGMLLFIPLTSTIYSLLRDDVNYRNQKKGRLPGQPELPGRDRKAAVQDRKGPEQDRNVPEQSGKASGQKKVSDGTKTDGVKADMEKHGCRTEEKQASGKKKVSGKSQVPEKSNEAEKLSGHGKIVWQKRENAGKNS